MAISAKYVYEKFSDEGDPVHDMGIGQPQFIKELQKKLDKFSPGTCYDWYDLYLAPICNDSYRKYSTSLVRLAYHTIKIFILKKNYSPQQAFEDTYKKELGCGYTKDYNKSERLKIRKKVAEFLNSFFNFKVDPRLNETVNEKFTEDSDAIADMNIGQNHFKEEIMKMLPYKYVHMGIDYIEYARYVLFSDETIVEKNNDFLSGNTIYTIICREYSKDKFFEKLEYLINAKGYIDGKGVAIDKIKQKRSRLIITLADSKDIDINEKFSDASDPIEDLNIGLYRTIVLYGMVTFKDGDIKIIEGNKVGDFFKISGVRYEMYDEYKSGIAALIFTGSQKDLLHVLTQFYVLNPDKITEGSWIFKVS